jgi:hypothetical protein
MCEGAEGGKKLLDDYYLMIFCRLEQGGDYINIKNNVYHIPDLDRDKAMECYNGKAGERKKIKKAHRKVAFSSKEA